MIKHDRTKVLGLCDKAISKAMEVAEKDKALGNTLLDILSELYTIVDQGTQDDHLSSELRPLSGFNVVRDTYFVDGVEVDAEGLEKLYEDNPDLPF